MSNKVELDVNEFDTINSPSNYEMVDWENMVSFFKLNDDFILKHYDKFNVLELAKNQNLSPEILEKVLEKTELCNVKCSIIPEHLIEKYATSYMDWVSVSSQPLSNEFIKKHIDKLDLDVLAENTHFTQEERDYYKQLSIDSE